ncbi:MAG: hypothetical protein J7K63_06825 [Candidatus Marinimicrobia bacterium]|nr:hypothetical protein [Candidatus Neomarinimicrobiota bacterium]
MKHPNNTWQRIKACLAVLFSCTILFSSCDINVPSKLEPPVWKASLTLPLIYEQYPVIDLENDSTFFAEGDTMFLRFGGSLGKVTLSKSNFHVPVNTEISVQEEGQTLRVDPVSREISDKLTIEDIVGASLSTIPPDVWNDAAADPIAEMDEMVDMGEETRDELNHYFSAYALETGEGSFFVTEFRNDLPGPIFIDTVKIEVIRDDMSRYDLVVHEGGRIAAYDRLRDSTDLTGKLVEGTRLNASMAIFLVPVSDTLYSNPDIEDGLFYRQNTQMSFTSIHGRTKEIVLMDTTMGFSLPQSNTQIEEGALSITGPDTNEINMVVLDNTFDAPIRFGLTFPQIQTPPPGNTPAAFPDTLLAPGLNMTLDLGGYHVKSSEDGELLNNLEYTYRVKIDSAAPDVAGYNAIFPLNESMGTLQVDFQVTDMRFDSLKGQFNMLLPGDEQKIELPEGITGIGIAEPEMTLRVQNHILPVKLIMDITAVKKTESRTMHVEPSLNHPDAAATDSALSIIKFNRQGMFVYWDDESNLVHVNETYPTIADLIDLNPKNFRINTSALVRGEGTIGIGDSLWADYTLEAPFKFLASRQSFIPKEYTKIAAWDSSTAAFIKKNATGAIIYANLTNHIPMHGTFTLLMSDSTIFPQDTLQTTLDSLNISGMENSRIYFNNGDTIRLDTLFSVPLPRVQVDPETGIVTAPIDSMVTDTISADLVIELTRQVNHYVMPRIDLQTSSDSLIFIRPQDYIGVHAYIGFRVNTGDFIYDSENDEEDGGE